MRVCCSQNEAKVSSRSSRFGMFKCLIFQDSFGAMLELTHLSLFNNSLNAIIPVRSIWVVTLGVTSLNVELFVIWLFFSLLQSFLGNLVKLEYLDLSLNQFRGTIPVLPRFNGHIYAKLLASLMWLQFWKLNSNLLLWIFSVEFWRAAVLALALFVLESPRRHHSGTVFIHLLFLMKLIRVLISIFICAIWLARLLRIWFVGSFVAVVDFESHQAGQFGFILQPPHGHYAGESLLFPSCSITFSLYSFVYFFHFMFCSGRYLSKSVPADHAAMAGRAGQSIFGLHLGAFMWFFQHSFSEDSIDIMREFEIRTASFEICYDRVISMVVFTAFVGQLGQSYHPADGWQ